MASAFYVQLGFSKIEIANVVKLFGVGATLLGVAAGGVLDHRVGTSRALVGAGVLAALSNFVFIGLAYAGHDLRALTGAVFVENFTSGIVGAAFVAYLSRLCNAEFTATQYACSRRSRRRVARVLAHRPASSPNTRLAALLRAHRAGGDARHRARGVSGSGQRARSASSSSSVRGQSDLSSARARGRRAAFRPSDSARSVRLVRGVHDPLHRRAAVGTRLAVAAVHGHLGPERGDVFRNSSPASARKRSLHSRSTDCVAS